MMASLTFETSSSSQAHSVKTKRYLQEGVFYKKSFYSLFYRVAAGGKVKPPRFAGDVRIQRNILL